VSRPGSALMRNIILILALLMVPYFGLAAFGVPEPLRGRIGITCVFLLTGSAHFFQARAMSEMIPPRIPPRYRLPVIYVSGAFELIAAIAILFPSLCRTVALLLCGFLVLVLPANIDSAIRRVPFGGHQAGPAYLFARIPLQFALIGWTYWFGWLSH
jgi:uncharacterized membrane protein